MITGVSGSGKSTLAFDILFNEGQRRYLESLNAYARQFVQPAARPDVDAIYGIPPTVAIEQRTSRGGRKSTVATLTEIYHFLRLLYVKLGTQYCPDCDVPIEPQSVGVHRRAPAAATIKGKRIALLAPLVVARKGYYTDLAKWAAKQGLQDTCASTARCSRRTQWPRLVRFKEHTIELPVAQIDVDAEGQRRLRSSATSIRRSSSARAWCTCSTATRSEPQGAGVLASSAPAPPAARSFAELDPRLFSFNSKHGWCESCFGTGARDRAASTRSRAARRSGGSTGSSASRTPARPATASG